MPHLNHISDVECTPGRGPEGFKGKAGFGVWHRRATGERVAWPGRSPKRAPPTSSMQVDTSSRATAASASMQQWRKHSAVTRDRLKGSPSFSGWTQRPQAKLVGVPKTDRVRDLLNTGWAARLHECGGPGQVSTARAAESFWANVAQAVQRSPWGNPGVLATSSHWYSYQFDFCLDGEDTLRLQGCPPFTAPLGQVEDRHARTLAGEGFNIPCLSTFAYSMYLNPWGPWWK